jgi:hypothetical protein
MPIYPKDMTREEVIEEFARIVAPLIRKEYDRRMALKAWQDYIEAKACIRKTGWCPWLPGREHIPPLK